MTQKGKQSQVKWRSGRRMETVTGSPDPLFGEQYDSKGAGEIVLKLCMARKSKKQTKKKSQQAVFI